MSNDLLSTHKNDHPEMYAENSKYKPKMTFTERCEALAAYKQGIEKPIIAACYGINISTLGFIIQPHSKTYRNVRREYEELGHERFLARYLTPAVFERLERASHDWKASIPAKDYDEVKQRLVVTDQEPDKRAKRYEGRQTLTWLGVGTIHVAVAYVDAVIPPDEHYPEQRDPGWYLYIDPTSPAFDEWMGKGAHGSAADRRTSTTAYEGFAKTIGHDVAQKGD